MRMHHEVEERRFRHEAELRKAEAEACREEMRAEAESHHEEAKAFREMMITMFGRNMMIARTRLYNLCHLLIYFIYINFYNYIIIKLKKFVMI